MSVSRYLVENHGSSQKSIKLAFSQALQACRANGLGNITLVFPTKGTFTSSDIAGYLGSQVTKALTKGSAVNLGDGVSLTLEIPKNINSFGRYDVLLAAYLTGRDMDVIDGVRNVSSIVFLPWSEDEGKRWLSTWSPQVVGEQSWRASTDSLPLLVQDVVLKLGRCINMSTGLSHPSDKDMAKMLFSELRKSGVSTSSEAVRQFAIQNGWEPCKAQELAKFAAKYIV